MVKARSHKELVVWQKAMDLAVLVYEHCAKLPPWETYGLASQMRRAVTSVPGNIAEGSARGTAKDYARFLGVAKGSLMETETYLTLAIRLGYLPEESVNDTFSLLIEISKMLTVMRIRLDENCNL